VGSTILVVEDDPMNAKFLEITLRRRGQYDVLMSEDADEVVRLVRERKVDLILMDVSLDNSYYRGVEVDGLMLTRIIKVAPETSHCPIILVTAHAMRGAGAIFLKETHADGYIPKPITDPQVLLTLIRDLLHPARAQTPERPEHQGET